jgi:hypothetical protein
MNASDGTTVTQLITAPGVRIAGRDYVESMGSSISLRVATMDSEQLRNESANNEYVFRYRFGISRPKDVRERLLGIAKDIDLSDAEVRWMLRADRDSVKLVAGQWCLLLGAFHAAAMTWFAVSSMLVVLANPQEPWRQLIASLVLGATWLGTTWLCDRLYLMPWRVWRDVTRSPLPRRVTPLPPL